MNIAELAIQKRTIALVICVLILAGGIVAYEALGRLEDPRFTIKKALVITNYPGATPWEVAEEVTDEIETALQQLPQLKRVESISKAGLSIVIAEIKEHYSRHSLPQVWDELRRKVSDIQPQLPPGALKPVVKDDFGDVYGILLAITGDGYSYEELKQYAQFLRREMLLIQDVGKIELWGLQEEALFVEISRQKMAQMGIGPDIIYATLVEQNAVSPAGYVRAGPKYIRVNPTGAFSSEIDVENLQIRDPASDRIIYLKDVATITRDYVSPPDQILRYNGKQALSIGVSIVPEGNVVKLGKAVKKRLSELKGQTPVGMELDVINFQADDVAKSVNNFLFNFLEAIVIVIAVLLITMGVGSGLVIGTALILNVMGVFIVMSYLDINLQRISLGALVISLGILVDNAIVVTEGILVRVKQGMDQIQAARESVSRSVWPLLGATVISILAFAAIGLSKHNTGEYLISLFQVMLISLMLSWLIAITLVPVFCTLFLGRTASAEAQKDPYDGSWYLGYKKLLIRCLNLRWPTTICLTLLLGIAFWGFGQLQDRFFPESTRPQFQLHYWLPAGTDIRKTSDDLSLIEKKILSDPRVASTTSYIGSGATRFMLTFQPELSQDKSYGLILIKVKDHGQMNHVIRDLMQYLTHTYPDAQPIIEKFALGPPGAGVKVRFSGPDPTVLRQLSSQAQEIMNQCEIAYAVRDDWRQKVNVIRPQYDETRARLAGISRPALNRSFETALTGTRVGIYREGDEMLPIIAREPEAERSDEKNIYNIQVWNSVMRKTMPVYQVVSGFQTVWEDEMIHRRNRKLTITAACEPVFGELPSRVFQRVKQGIEAIALPAGYERQWGGEHEESKDAQENLMASVPVTLVLMVLITIMLFNNLLQPLIIWITVPLSVIGVSLGLLAFGLPFDFMALLGFICLAGMLIKNAIVLVDQINVEIRDGREPFQALIHSAVSRVRPVSMAAFTTVLGMAPLLQDIFFRSMAVTIMAGLTFATLLTLIAVPVLYSLFYRVDNPPL